MIKGYREGKKKRLPFYLQGIRSQSYTILVLGNQNSITNDELKQPKAGASKDSFPTKTRKHVIF